MRRDLLNAVLAEMRGEHQKVVRQGGTSERAPFQHVVPTRSNTRSNAGDEKEANEINHVPTVPTVPTRNVGSKRERVKSPLSYVGTSVGTASELTGTKEAAPEPRRCSCGAPAYFGEGWSLRGPGNAAWFCGACVPSREEVFSIAGGPGAPSSSRNEEPARDRWWEEPVEDWPEGTLTIRNVLTGVETVIDLRGGQ